MKKSKFSILLALSLSILLFYQCKNEQNSLVESSEIETKSNITKADTSKFQKLNFHINIDAPVDVVYKTVIDSNLFMDWTSAFGPGSYYKGNWEKGSKMIFIADMEDGSQAGMISHIKDHVPKQLISIEHLGMLQNGEEILEGEDVDSFKGSIENYSFSTNGKITTMIVNTDVFMETDSFFNKTWPLALERIKELSEN